MAEIDTSDGVARSWRFGPFMLDEGKRRLVREGEPIPLNARYFDALVLLLEADGAVVAKDTFMDRAWHGVPVTDEALTQAIRSLRKALADDAASPSYIATVPKHGYRFIADTGLVEIDEEKTLAAPVGWNAAGAAVLGGAIAGLLVGAGYGALVSPPDGGSVLSGLLVMMAVGIAAGVVAGLGIGIGTHLALRRFPEPRWAVAAGAALGGLVTGALGRMLALDGFGLLLGSAPAAMTGALEGAAMGLAVGLGLIRRGKDWVAPALIGGVAGGLFAGALALSGSRFLGGSLADLGMRFAGSRLDMASVGAVFGESGFGQVTLVVTGMAEAFAFCACVAGAIARLAQR